MHRSHPRQRGAVGNVVRALKTYRQRPYLVFNTAVIERIKVAQEQDAYRNFINSMMAVAEKYCLMDDGTRFWADQFHYLNTEDEQAIIKHFHLTVARQRVAIRLCPPATLTLGWKDITTSAVYFFERHG